ncbi:MAG: helix-turn-helix transcriptional regulator [Verrucomicrobiae bacterium]|nr:helix-turn-helix transcriptional regulator [Verrucomicrobiae bacterium]
MPQELSRQLSRDYRDPHTRLGIDLTPESGSGASSFLVQECGFRHYENWNHRGIRSPYWRLHHNFEAGNSVRSQGSEYALNPDVVVLIPGGVPLDTLGRKTVPHLWIHYLPSKEFLLAMRTPVVVPTDTATQAALTQLRNLFDEGLIENSQRMHHLSKAVLHLVFARLDSEAFLAFPDRLLPILEHIDRHLGEDLSTPRLAKLNGMTRHRLTQLFQKHTGLSPSRYVADLRVRLAMQRLAATDESIEQIAEALGFPNRYYFSRVFQKQLGCGPATFRRGQR